MRGFREDEVQGPFLTEKKSGCSPSVESTKESNIFQGHKKLLGTVLGAETVLNIGSHASPCGSTPPVVQHRAAAAFSSSGTLVAKSFPVSKGGSTHRGSCNDNSICGTVDETSPFGFPEFVFNCEPDGSEDVATKASEQDDGEAWS